MEVMMIMDTDDMEITEVMMLMPIMDTDDMETIELMDDDMMITEVMVKNDEKKISMTTMEITEPITSFILHKKAPLKEFFCLYYL